MAMIPKAAEALAMNGGRPVRSEFLVFGKPRIEEAEIREVVDTLRSGWLGTGPKVHEFERRFAAYVNVNHAVALNSCTAGLHLALLVAGIGPGDEVITTPMTFAATANVIVHCGAIPIFADVHPRELTIDPERVEKAITPRTKALLPVHFAGRPCDMDALLDIARRHNLVVIEDAAHAIETQYRGRKVGSIADLTAFSFYVTKNVVTGEGGMVTTQNSEWADRLRVLSLHGLSRDAWKRFSSSGYQHYDTVAAGFKYNMMDIQASIGIHQLARVEEYYPIRRKMWQRYNQAFADLPVFVPEFELERGSRHALHLYTLLLDLKRLTCDRDLVLQALKQENIGVGVHYTAVHLHSFYKNTFQLMPGAFPNAEWISERTLSLPLGPGLNEGDVEDVVTAVRKVLRHFAK